VLWKCFAVRITLKDSVIYAVDKIADQRPDAALVSVEKSGPIVVNNPSAGRVHPGLWKTSRAGHFLTGMTP
jgi:hypothetical protein